MRGMWDGSLPEHPDVTTLKPALLAVMFARRTDSEGWLALPRPCQYDGKDVELVRIIPTSDTIWTLVVRSKWRRRDRTVEVSAPTLAVRRLAAQLG